MIIIWLMLALGVFMSLLIWILYKSEAFSTFEARGVSDSAPVEKTAEEFGLCFSGGGAVAMVYTAAFLRGLKHVGVLNSHTVSRISASSGGTWALVPCAYVSSTQPLSLDRILGVYKDPTDCKMYDMINVPPPPFVGNAARGYKLLQLMATAFQNLTTAIPKDQVVLYTLAQHVLKPLGLHSPVCFVQSTKSKSLTVQKEFSSIDNSTAFYHREEFPFPHCMFTAISKSDTTEYYPVEMTPDTIGCLCGKAVTKAGHSIGGRVANYCFGGSNSVFSPDAVTTAITNEFVFGDLHKYVGYPSAIMTLYQQRTPLIAKFTPATNINLPNCSETEVYVGDGGYYDDSGASALLARQVRHICVFLFDGCLDVKGDIYPIALQQLFGNKIGKLAVFSVGLLQDDDKHTLFWDAVNTLTQKMEQKQAAIYTRQYITRTVPEASITPYNVTITWVIPSVIDEYHRLYSTDIQKKLEYQHDHKNYPQYIVPPLTLDLVELSDFDIQAMMNLGSWIAVNKLASLFSSK